MCKIQFPFFHLSDGETKVIRFLDNTPIEFYEHSFNIGGKYKTLTCARTGCPLCKIGEKPRFVGVYPIISRKDKIWNSEKEILEDKTDVFMLYRQGIKVLKFIDRQHMEGRLLGRDWKITRTGSEMDTVYNFIPLDKTPAPELKIPDFVVSISQNLEKLQFASDTIQMNSKTLIKDTFFAIVDIETTGLSSHFGDRICELAVLRIQNGKEVGSFTSLINPKKPISPGASDVNGITDDMVKNSPTFDTIIDKILPLLKDSCIVCHNAPFDLSFISTQMKNLRLPSLKNPVIDTLFLARKYFDFPSNALGNIARHLNISPRPCTQERGEHRAMGDVLITQKLFDYFIKDLEKRKNIRTLEDLLKLQGGSIKIPEPEEIILPPIIEEAFKSKRIIKIEYVSKIGVETVREIEPIEVSRYSDYIYLVAFCNLRKEERTFRLDRIINMTLK